MCSPRELLLITEREELKLVTLTGQEMAVRLGKAVTSFHASYSLELDALSQSKGLLALSAKFCMVRN